MAGKRRPPTDHVTCKHCHQDFGAITVLHLRNIHGYEGDHPINDYKARFRLESALSGEARQKISATKEDFWARRGQHWTRETLLAEIRRLYRTGRRLRRQRVPVRVYEAGRRFFGTWQAAVESAGFDYEEATGVIHWTPEKVVEAIRERAERGVPLTATYVAVHDPVLYNAATKQFPRSWAKALRAAGIDPDEHRVRRGRWDRRRAEDWVRKRQETGRSLLGRDAPRDLVDFVHNRLRMAWTDFVESLGIPYPGIKKRRDWTRQKVLAEIRRWQAEGHPLNYRAVKDEYQALLHQARKFFGSWERACRSAGVKVVPAGK